MIGKSKSKLLNNKNILIRSEKNERASCQENIPQPDLNNQIPFVKALSRNPIRRFASAASLVALSIANIVYPTVQAAAPVIDLDFVPFQGPGEGTFIEMNFSGATFDVGTSGDGVGGFARYSNIGFYLDPVSYTHLTLPTIYSV